MVLSRTSRHFRTCKAPVRNTTYHLPCILPHGRRTQACKIEVPPLGGMWAPWAGHRGVVRRRWCDIGHAASLVALTRYSASIIDAMLIRTTADGFKWVYACIAFGGIQQHNGSGWLQPSTGRVHTLAPAPNVTLA